MIKSLQVYVKTINTQKTMNKSHLTPISKLLLEKKGLETCKLLEILNKPAIFWKKANLNYPCAIQ